MLLCFLTKSHCTCAIEHPFYIEEGLYHTFLSLQLIIDVEDHQL